MLLTLANLRWPLLFTALVGLSGCVSAPPVVEQSEPRPEISPEGSEGRIRHELTDRKVAELWQRAEELRAEGEFKRAGEILEQALVLNPDDAVVWSRVAEMQLRTGKLVQAENYAFKSNELAPDNKHLKYRNWLLIMHAREQRKDLVGAAEARSNADKLKP